MNKEQYDQLTNNVKQIATECYIDGYKSAISLVESITMRTGDTTIDNAFDNNKKSILTIMHEQYRILKESK